MSKILKSNNFQKNDEIKWECASPGVERQVFGYDDRVMLVKVSYVESGVFELTIGGEKQLLKTGDGFYVPPNTLHGSVCLEAGVLIDVFSPHREDFL